LADKPLSGEDRRIMNELIEEHVFGRRTTKALIEANTRYRNGDESALAGIVEKLQTLVAFYPRHIEKGDKVFFPSSRAYFTDEEDQAMLAEFWEFDRRMIHEKYKSLVEGIEQQSE
jgi:hemerythrin-like domain-containing protein